jgi:hypothetical protein
VHGSCAGAGGVSLSFANDMSERSFAVAALQ